MAFYWIISVLVWLLAFVYAQNEPRYIRKPLAEQAANVLTATTIALLWPLGLVLVVFFVALGKFKATSRNNPRISPA